VNELMEASPEKENSLSKMVECIRASCRME